MNFDLRMPIGILFTLFGMILTGFGIFTKGSEIYQKSLNQNVNIEWGITLLVFGILMLFFAIRGRKA
jgi:uncharacterized membrane protein HdeD (DUF308 family)